MSKRVMISDNFFFLKPWMEIRGKLHRIETDEYNLYLDIEKKILVFRKELDTTSFIVNKISKKNIGKEIAILRTDLPEKPFLIKIFSKRNSDEEPNL